MDTLPALDVSLLQLEVVSVVYDDRVRVAVLARQYGEQSQYATVVLDHQFMECEYDCKHWIYVVRSR